MSNAYEIEARVRRFTPRILTEAEWTQSRDAVVAAAVAAAPVGLEQAKLFASRLCAFLGWLPAQDWDRAVAPDIGAVLTDARIRAFTSPKGMPRDKKSSRDQASVILRRLAGEVSGVGRVRAGRVTVGGGILLSRAAACRHQSRAVDQRRCPEGSSIPTTSEARGALAAHRVQGDPLLTVPDLGVHVNRGAHGTPQSWSLCRPAPSPAWPRFE